MDSRTNPSRTSIAAFAAWVAAVVAVLGSMIVYGGTAGAQRPAPKTWPEGTTITRSMDGPTLLIFLHPECPCSRATLDNLEPLAEDQTVAIVVVCRGELDFSTRNKFDALGGCRNELHGWAERPNVTLVPDPDGHEAARFGALTSGYCLLFDAGGELAYSGGATSSRGHQGANAGVASLQAILDRSAHADNTYPVYGCPLQEEQCNKPEFPSETHK